MNLRHFTALIALAALATIGACSPSGGEELSTPTADQNRLIFWTGCERIVGLSDEELDAWRERGVDGFVCMAGRLRELGGDQQFTADPRASLDGPSYALQRQLRDSRLAERAADRGMKLYLGAYLANYDNTATPLADWFDDAGWSKSVLPSFRGLAGAARRLGFAGVALDQELYSQTGGVDTATWNWNYPGNVRSETEVRTQARRRGEQMMTAILDEFPHAELAVYHYWLPGDWRELVYEEIYEQRLSSTRTVHVNFWDGMTRIEGYRAIRFWDNIFYKTPHRGTWETALTYNQNRVFETLSKSFSNWDYASERVYVSPFSWIDSGPNETSSFDDARTPEYVAEQLAAFRRWSMGGELANYAYGSLSGFDYSPYQAAMQAASAPQDDADSEAPALQLADQRPGSGRAPIQGTAHDNLAIRAVRWRDDGGGSGVAEMHWKVLAGDLEVGYEWEMRWALAADAISPDATEVTITAEDIKGNASKPVVYPLP